MTDAMDFKKFASSIPYKSILNAVDKIKGH